MLCDITSMILENYSKRSFSRKKQNNELLQKKFTETIKRRGKIA